MNTLSYRTESAKPAEVVREWYVIDAEDVPLGRLASHVAHILRGKNKPSYTPHVDCGDNVIILNADKVAISGSKRSQKEYITFSGYPGGQKRMTFDKMIVKKPTYPLEQAVKGMLPKNRLGRQMFKKLFAYTGADHPHQAQQPKKLSI